MNSAIEEFSGWITPDHVFDGKALLDNKSLFVSNNIVRKIDDAVTDSIRIAGIISPGFFDIQVNGGGGVLFNSCPTVDGIGQIVNAHRQRGTTSMLPTVITDKPEILDAACCALIEAKSRYGPAGIHIEGPHISLAKAGVHSKHNIRPLGTHTLRLLQKLRDNHVPTLITIAPESVSRGQIAQMAEMGVRVALGHSNSAAREVCPCADEGAALFTHLYNAMSPMTSREPGMVGTAINSSLYCSIICDGKHVAPEMIRLAINARPRQDRMIIVSDAMPTVGGGNSYFLYEEQIELRNGTLVDNNGALAGAHITMGESIDFLTHTVGLNLETCLQMATTHPATLMGLNQLSELVGLPLSQCIVFERDRAAEAALLNRVFTANYGSNNIKN